MSVFFFFFYEWMYRLKTFLIYYEILHYSHETNRFFRKKVFVFFFFFHPLNTFSHSYHINRIKKRNKKFSRKKKIKWLALVIAHNNMCWQNLCNSSVNRVDFKYIRAERKRKIFIFYFSRLRFVSVRLFSTPAYTTLNRSNSLLVYRKTVYRQ